MLRKIFFALLAVVAALTFFKEDDPAAGVITPTRSPEVQKKVADCERNAGFVGVTVLDPEDKTKEVFLYCSNPVTGYRF